MKTSKLLFVLAIAAGFAACTKEVLVEPEKTVDSFDEIKGAKVLANGFSVDLAPEAQTKVDVIDGIAQFVKDDVAGVAWFVKDGNVTGDQSVDGKEKLWANAYANHKITHDGMGFKSNSNVYEGWHIAYFPYQEMRKPGWLTFTVNPELDRKITDRDSYGKEQLENSVMFSVAYFLGQEDVKEGIIQTDMPLQFVVNALRPRFALAEDFKTEDILKKNIKSVTLSAKQPLFAETLTVNPSKFPSGEGKFNKAHFGANDDPLAVNSSEAALQARPAYVTSVTTNVAENVLSEYKLGSGDLNFRWFVAPMPKPSKKLAATDFTVTVTLDDDSEFILKVDKNDTESTNYEAFKKLADYINGDRKNAKDLFLQDIILDEYGGLQAINLDFALSAAEYQITHKAGTPEEWRAVVDLASSMGAAEVDITLTGNFEIPTVDGEMYTKGLAISLKGTKTLNFNTDTKWSDNISLVSTSVNVAEGVKLTVGEKGLTTKGNITNAGTIVLLDGADLNAGNTKTITNTGNIEVSVGSVLTAKTVSNTGTVVFTVKEDVPVTVNEINDLVDNASLNKLVVEADIKSDIPVDWTGVTVEMNGAVLTADVTADAINVNEGENAINGTINAPVTVAENANLVIKGTQLNDTLTIEKGAEVSIAANEYDSMKINDIVNNGNLNANTNVYVETIQTNEESITIVLKGKAIYYPKDDYEYSNNGGTVTGNILPYELLPESAGYQVYNGVYFVKTADGFETVLNQDVEKITMELDGNVSISPKGTFGGALTSEIVINANGHEITFVEPDANANYINSEATLKISNATINRTTNYDDDGTHVHELKFNCPVEFDNVEFNNTIQLANTATLNNISITDATASEYAIWIPLHGQTVTLTGENTITAARGIKICESLTPSDAEVPTLKVSGTKFNTPDKAAVLVRAKIGAIIEWGANNDISGTADAENAVWIDEDANSIDYLANLKLTGANWASEK